MKTLYESILDDEEDILDKQTINLEDWLNENSIWKGTYKYRKTKNGTVIDFNGGIKFAPHVESIPFKFGIVTGAFNCQDTQLTSLKNCPDEVGSFSCKNTFITSLEGCPKIVHGSFNCSGCKITSLEGAPKKIAGDYYLYNLPKLKSLEGGPEIIENSGCLEIKNCASLTSLKGCPLYIPGSLVIGNCPKLKSLKGCARSIRSFFSCENLTAIKNLKGGPTKVLKNYSFTGGKSLISLEGAPEKIEDSFDISGCTALKNLKNGPKNIDGGMWCDNCTSLESFDGLLHCWGHLSVKNCPKLDLKSVRKAYVGHIYS